MRLSVLLLAACVLIGLVACSQEIPRQPLERVGLFSVDGKQPFLETGYDLVPGRYYQFFHRGGAVCVQDKKRCSAPRGSDVPGEEAWGLKLKVGDEYIQLRDRMVLSVESTTPLTFYIPEGEVMDWSEDKRSYYEDNSGAWDIEVLTFSEAPDVDFIRGANLTSYSADGYCSPELPALLRRLNTLGANAVQFVVVYETDGKTIYPANYSPRAFCIAKATKEARKFGFSVGWNLHVDPPNDGWRGALQPPDHAAFFAEYRSFARYFAALAQDHEVDFLIPATEMVSLMVTDEDQNAWLAIFNDLHSLFFGTIYYAADRSEFAQIDGDFWRSCCDAVGITPWYTLSDKPVPDALELKAAWKETTINMEKFADATHLRIILPEGPGYRAQEGCAIEPADYLVTARRNDLCQAEAYKAFLQTFTSDKRQLIAGYYLWEITVAGEKGSGYSPLESITESILKQAWKGN